jgi:hypothetical protein
MTVADQTEDHQARCVPHLTTLRMLARTEVDAPLPWLAAEVIQATEAILAEAEAAAREAGTAAEVGLNTGIFLGVRLSRLASAAGDAIAAAWAGDFAQLRRHLARFDTLTSAIWAVQDAGRSRAQGSGASERLVLPPG